MHLTGNKMVMVLFTLCVCFICVELYSTWLGSAHNQLFHRIWDVMKGSSLSDVAVSQPHINNLFSWWKSSFSPGIYGPDEGWASAYPQCKERNQSPINIVDQDAKVSTEYQELTLEGFDAESSNKTSMKNTGKTGTAKTSQAYEGDWISSERSTFYPGCTFGGYLAERDK